jgi:hypothetical protein
MPEDRMGPVWFKIRHYFSIIIPVFVEDLFALFCRLVKSVPDDN